MIDILITTLGGLNEGAFLMLALGRLQGKLWSAASNLDINTVFALEPRKITENLDRIDRLLDLRDAK